MSQSRAPGGSTTAAPSTKGRGGLLPVVLVAPAVILLALFTIAPAVVPTLPGPMPGPTGATSVQVTVPGIGIGLAPRTTKGAAAPRSGAI